MRLLLLSLAIFSGFADADDYICSYPNYVNGEPVILKISIQEAKAIVKGSLQTSEYAVLENNELGVVLATSFSTEGLESPKQNDIGLMAIVIDKNKMKMIRGNITYPDTENSLKTGTCTK